MYQLNTIIKEYNLSIRQFRFVWCLLNRTASHGAWAEEDYMSWLYVRNS